MAGWAALNPFTGEIYPAGYIPRWLAEVPDTGKQNITELFTGNSKNGEWDARKAYKTFLRYTPKLSEAEEEVDRLADNRGKEEYHWMDVKKSKSPKLSEAEVDELIELIKSIDPKSISNYPIEQVRKGLADLDNTRVEEFKTYLWELRKIKEQMEKWSTN
jgi:hypothetical protein